MSTLLRIAPLAVTLSLATALATGCAEEEPEPIPLEDSYTWTIQSGRVCAPSVAHTGSDDAVPVRYEMCVYRCLGASGAVDHLWAWSCGAGKCQFELAPTWEMEQVVNEQGCDARDLVDPPESECNEVSYDFSIQPPKNSMGEFVEGDYVMNVPYLDHEQAAALQSAVDDGSGLFDALDTALGGLQVIPERQFDLEFSASAPVATHADLTDGDCHEIPLPDFAG